LNAVEELARRDVLAFVREADDLLDRVRERHFPAAAFRVFGFVFHIPKGGTDAAAGVAFSAETC
jgi:predicted RNase H-like nuclease